jgi:hypothetical protein
MSAGMVREADGPVRTPDPPSEPRTEASEGRTSKATVPHFAADLQCLRSRAARRDTA